jgi:predicted DNA-binding protein (UPF0278 family)
MSKQLTSRRCACEYHDPGKSSRGNLFLPAALYKEIRAGAEKRDVSNNVIVDFAMAQWLAKKGPAGVRPL